MDDDLKTLVNLYDELREFCHCACKDCYIDKLKRKYNIEEMNIHCSALLYNTLTQWIEGWKNNGWKRKTGEIKNLDLVKQLYEYSNKEVIFNG